MEYLWIGLCGLLLIVGLVGIIMSNAIWRPLQMAVTVLVLLFSLVFFYMAARTLKLRQNWENEIKAYELAINKINKGAGSEEQPGLEKLRQNRDDLKRQFAAALNLRGRVWQDGQKSKSSPQTGALTVAFENPPPGLDAVTRPVFVFQAPSESGATTGSGYLGEFTVKEANAREVTLVPVATLTNLELTNIDTVRGALVIYEVMPIDSHNLFATADPSNPNLKNLSADFKRDGKPAGPKDEEEHPENVWKLVKFTQNWTPPSIAGAAAAPAAAPAAAGQTPVPAPAPAPAPAEADANKQAPLKGFAAGWSGYLPAWDVQQTPDEKGVLKTEKLPGLAQQAVDAKAAEYVTTDPEKATIFVRSLRDYANLFREAYRARTALYAEQNELKDELAQITSALDKVKTDLTATKTVTEGLTSDKQNFLAEAKIVEQFATAIGAKLDATRSELSSTYRSNMKLAAEWADLQARLAQRLKAAPAPGTSAAVDPRSGR